MDWLYLLASVTLITAILLLNWPYARQKIESFLNVQILRSDVNMLLLALLVLIPFAYIKLSNIIEDIEKSEQLKASVSQYNKEQEQKNQEREQKKAEFKNNKQMIISGIKKNIDAKNINEAVLMCEAQSKIDASIANDVIRNAKGN